MALTREVSLGVGLGTAAIVYNIYQGHLPSIAEARVSPPNDDILSGSERTAAWLSAGFVFGIAAITRDPTVLVIGGVVLVGLSWAHRHANTHNPMDAGYTPSSAQVAVEDQSYVPA